MTDSRPTLLPIDTPHGIAHAHLHAAEQPRAALVMSHGAGGGIDAPDLVATTQVALARGISVVLVEQPYRVSGRRAPAPARQLDVNWIAIIEQLRAGPLAGLPVIVGGRSMGARVACRTSSDVGAVGVLCLAFPLQPRPRKSGTLAPSRLPELDAVTVPVLVVQGERDPFGMPPAADGRTVVQVAGDHALKADVDAVAAAVDTWLGQLLPG